MNNFLAAIHEGGHYLYETSLPAEHFGTPICEALSLGFHESQSRWWECYVGQGLPFWKHYFPRLKKLFPTQLKGITLPTFYRGLNAILDTPIRILSDEISYPLHVIIRFEIESALVDGTLKIRDLPEAWNSRYQEYLGITPKNDAEGCLQDVHWGCGLIGYFPTYALGTMYAAQMFDTYTKTHRTWSTQVAKGQLRPHAHLAARQHPPIGPHLHLRPAHQAHYRRRHLSQALPLLPHQEVQRHLSLNSVRHPRNPF